MRQLQRTRIQRPNNPQRFPHDDILGIFPTDFRFKPISHPGLREPFDTLRQGPLQDDIEGKLVVIGGEDLGLSLACISELPRLLVKYPFLPRFATAGG